MPAGKSISLFLIDGEPSGRIACELFNWTGKAFKIPRSLLKESANRPELHKAGVYFLFGRDEDEPDSGLAYIGEAEEAYKRLTQHQEKDFWTDAVVFVSKDENLNKAHVKYLEFAAHQAAVEAKRYRLYNGLTPASPAISEPEQAVMGEFFENLKLLIGTLGYRLFEPLTPTSGKRTPSYHITASRGARATAQVTTEGIVVMAGSKASLETVPSTPRYVMALRTRLREAGVLVAEGEALRFTQDHLFASPSAAAAVVLGRSANGRVEWRDRKGRTLRDHEEA